MLIPDRSCSDSKSSSSVNLSGYSRCAELLRNEGVEDFLLPFPHSSVLRLKGPGTKGQEYRLPKRHAVDLQTSAATQQRKESTNQDENAPCKIWLITLQF